MTCGGQLPANMLITYYWPFNGGSPSIDAIRTTTAPAHYNVLDYIGAVGDGSGGGTVVLNGGPIPDLAGQITRWKESGRIALLLLNSIGNGAGPRLTNPTQVTRYVNSISTLVDTYGFQGVDWDWEDGGGQSNQASIVSVSQQLKAKYGNSFIIIAIPRSYEIRNGGLWSKILKGLIAANALDAFGLQEYDSTIYADPALAQIKADYADAISQGFPANKMFLGTSTPSGVSVAGGFATAQMYANAYTFLKNTYPGFRGAAVWQSFSDQQDAPSWNYGAILGAAINPPLEDTR